MQDAISADGWNAIQLANDGPFCLRHGASHMASHFAEFPNQALHSQTQLARRKQIRHHEALLSIHMYERRK